MEGLKKSNSRERIAVDTGRYGRIANELCMKHADSIYESKNSFPPVPELNEKLQVLPSALLASFWGHGITRGPIEKHVAAVLSVIENSAITGDMGSLAQSGYIDAYTHGSFLVILNQKDVADFRAKSSEQRRAFLIELVDKDGSIKRAMPFKPLAVVSNTHTDVLSLI